MNEIDEENRQEKKRSDKSLSNKQALNTVSVLIELTMTQ